MVYRRFCRNCPIEGCGAKYLVKLSNHLHDVHGLNPAERRKYLQESKLQPRVKVVVYQEDTQRRPYYNLERIPIDVQEKNNILHQTSTTPTHFVYQYSIPRNQCKEKVAKNFDRSERFTN